jgi:hypothetical protein
MNRLHCQPWFVRNDAQQRGSWSGRATSVLLPVLERFYADADQMCKLGLRKTGPLSNRPHRGGANYHPAGRFFLAA